MKLSGFQTLPLFWNKFAKVNYFFCSLVLKILKILAGKILPLENYFLSAGTGGDWSRINYYSNNL